MEILIDMKSKVALVLFILLTALTGCKKEIDFDYHEMQPIVVVEGRVTNEGMTVRITKTRSVTDSVKGRCLQQAVVHILSEGQSEPLYYDEQTDSYRSDKAGVVGQTYRLQVDYEQCHYEATSVMMPPAPLLSAEFLWQPVLKERLLAFEVWAADPAPTERNYYWYRMDRISHHPHFQAVAPSLEAYRWSVFDDRGCPPGKIYRDVMCMSQRVAEEDEEENWKSILYDGDSIMFQFLTIDRPTYDYYSSLRAGQGGGANPKTALSGGCQGYFVAGSISRTDTIVFRPAEVKER